MLSCANKTGDKYWNACQVPAGLLKGSRAQSDASVPEASMGAELDPVLLSANLLFIMRMCGRSRPSTLHSNEYIINLVNRPGPVIQTVKSKGEEIFTD